MGFFNVIKGAYPDLKQLDKTLPLGTGGTALVRGSLMLASANTFIPTDGTKTSNGCGNLTSPTTGNVPGPIVYFCLQNAFDPDVKMANGITGMPCTQPMEVETDQYDDTSIVLGSYLMAGEDGLATLHVDGGTAIGLVTKAAYTRWSNNAVVVEGYKTGGRITVISFWTMYAPVMANA